MSNKSFTNFKEASEYAQSLASKNLKHTLRRDGEIWVVISDETDVVKSKTEECAEEDKLIEQLNKTINEKIEQIKVLETKNLKLEDEYSNFKNMFENEVDLQARKLKEDLNNQKDKFTKEKEELKGKLKQDISQL